MIGYYAMGIDLFEIVLKISSAFISINAEINWLKSDSHVLGNVCQIKTLPSLLWKITIICLFGVLKL